MRAVDGVVERIAPDVIRRFEDAADIDLARGTGQGREQIPLHLCGGRQGRGPARSKPEVAIAALGDEDENQQPYHLLPTRRQLTRPVLVIELQQPDAVRALDEWNGDDCRCGVGDRHLPRRERPSWQCAGHLEGLTDRPIDGQLLQAPQ